MLWLLPLVGGRKEEALILYFSISLFWSSSNNKKITFIQFIVSLKIQGQLTSHRCKGLAEFFPSQSDVTEV